MAQPRITPGFGKRARGARAFSLGVPRVGWKTLGALAVLCSGVAMASLPKPHEMRSDEQRQWQALAIAPLDSGGDTGMRMAPSDAAEPIEFAPVRAVAPIAMPEQEPAPATAGPLRIRGRVGDGLYWSLRAAGASPQVAAQYLAALATEIDVGGDVSSGDQFDMVLGGQGETLLYAGLDRGASTDLQLVRWDSNGRSQWVDAANAERPAAPIESGLRMPAAGPITSYFGNRYHPILHFTRFHAGVDIGAGWGSPIVAAADGQIIAAGWAGGYGREVRIGHPGGLMTIYGHMSGIVAAEGSFVRAGQLIGYVGSSGLSTGPHLHFEVRRDGVPVNPLAVRFTSVQIADAGLSNAVKTRLKALLRVSVKRG